MNCCRRTEFNPCSQSCMKIQQIMQFKSVLQGTFRFYFCFCFFQLTFPAFLQILFPEFWIFLKIFFAKVVSKAFEPSAPILGPRRMPTAPIPLRCRAVFCSVSFTRLIWVTRLDENSDCCLVFILFFLLFLIVFAWRGILWTPPYTCRASVKVSRRFYLNWPQTIKSAWKDAP